MAERTHVDDYEGSGVWYCRKHCGTVNEDEGHDEDDACPWTDGETDDDGNLLDPCDWTELLYEVATPASSEAGA